MVHRIILLISGLILCANSLPIKPDPRPSSDQIKIDAIVDLSYETKEDDMERAVPLPVDSEPSMDDIDSAPEKPPPIPKLNKAEKWALIRAYGKDPTTRRRRKHDRIQALKRGKRVNVKRDLAAPWRITHTASRNKPQSPSVPDKPAMALPIDECPRQFDAVTRGINGRIYMFARDKVYQVWHEDGLPQKASYLISDLFTGGPRTVTAALTNSRSGVTILISGRTAYRFRWNKKHKRFQFAKNTPQEMPRNVTITPQTAFEWYDGNQVVMSGAHFFIYDAYWNVPTFTGHTRRYFPSLPADIIGITYNGGTTLLMYTKSNTIKVYNTKRYKVVQEYPINIGAYAGCLTELPKPKDEKPKNRQKTPKG
ncbi:hypothetical protein WR25_23621 [Diploscapter pachys]|uniref:Uncharacterized protein n=1 Tax=Diploscapter pachys TaxID=2018661 RepID=A0A2A2J7A9_9BILA|nr:hypothetical protein WR25_23621 [Diploscapter pachys]